MPLLPQVPTIAEAGVPGYSAEPRDGFAVPAGTPDEVMDRLKAALKASLATPEVAEMFVRTSGRIETSASPAAFEKFVREELERDIKLAKKLGLKAE
jgi:tripartite-type tricarboxylate transporter receptor subunit TctC